jgi:hypothetical protein
VRKDHQSRRVRGLGQVTGQGYVAQDKLDGLNGGKHTVKALTKGPQQPIFSGNDGYWTRLNGPENDLPV